MLLSNPFLSGKTFDSEWKCALKTIKAMLSQKDVPQPEWQGLFEIMNGLTTWIDNGNERVAAELTKVLEAHVNAAAKSLPTQSDDHTLLTAYVQQWINYMVMVDYLPKPFFFLTRNAQNTKMHPAAKKASNCNQNPVRRSMLQTWHKDVFTNIKLRLLRASMELIRKDREGEHVEKYLVENVRKSFVELCPNEADALELYRQEYEKAYYENLASFYLCRTADYLQSNGILSYIAYADKKLIEELDRASKYLERGNAETDATLLQKCLDVLYNNYEEQILAECLSLIKSSDIEKLQMIYRLAHRTPNGSKVIKETLFHYIRREGLDSMIQNAKDVTSDCDKYVEQLLEMHGRFTTLIEKAFNNDSKYLTERDKAFKEIVNNTEVFKLDVSKNYKGPIESRSPELLAIYCDQLLRKSAVSKRLTSEEIDEKLNNIILVLKYVQNKDIFMRFHKLHMSRRLILETTSDQEKEENLVRRFREIGMPADYVNKLSRMLQDIEINKDTNISIKRAICQSNNNDSTVSIVDMMSLKILNVGAWGKSRYVNITLPREIEDCSHDVQECYKKMHVGRKLYWSSHMSSAAITINNKNGKYDLDVSALQLSVLNAFNERPSARLTFDDLRIATELLDVDLNRTLMSLVAFPKLKRQLLLTNCETLIPKNFTDSTLFWINDDFGITKNDKIQPRGRLNLIGRLNIIDATPDQECDEVIRLRCFRLQEAIIKIMKARRKITSAQLDVELVEQLKHMFLPSKKLIKEQIEWLIDNKYMARDENDMNIFMYTT